MDLFLGYPGTSLFLGYPGTNLFFGYLETNLFFDYPGIRLRDTPPIIPPHAILSTKEQISLLVTNQLWQISFFQPIWNDFDGLTLRLHVNSAKYIAR